MTIYSVPIGYILVGTCGNCGGPVLMQQVFVGDEPPRHCADCGKKAKSTEPPRYGPIVEMKP